jgi:hypothetical protein
MQTIRSKLADVDWKHLGLAFFYRFLSVVSFITCFLGLVVFLYVSILIPFTYVVTMLSYICLKYRVSMFGSVMWCLYGIPLLDVILSLNWHIIFSFFRQLQQSLSIEGIEAYIDRRIEKSRHVYFAYLQIVLITLAAVGVVAGLICAMSLHDENKVIIVTLLISLLAGIVAVIAFLKILLFPWRLIFRLCCARMRGEQPVLDTAANSDTALPLQYQDQSVAAYDEVAKEKPADKQGQALEEHLSLVDPCGLLRMEEWEKAAQMLAVPLQSGERGKEFWLAIAFGLIQVIYIIVDCVDTHDDPFLSKGLLAVRILFAVFSFPFVTLMNGSVLFTRFQDLKEKHSLVRIIKTITVVFIGLVFLLLIAFTILVHDAKLHRLSHLDYVPPSHRPVTTTGAAPFCSTTAGGWSVMELAGLAMAAHHLESPDRDVAWPILAYLAGTPYYPANWTIYVVNQTIPGVKPIFKRIPSLYVLDSRRPKGVMAFQGFAQLDNLGVLLENIIAYWYDAIISAIVPLFEVVKNVFMGSLLMSVTVSTQTFFLGLSEATPEFFRRGIRTLDRLRERIEDVPVFTGHMSGGMISKALGIANDTYAVAFESPRFVHSRISDEVKSNLNLKGVKLQTRNIVNVFSNTSLFSVSDISAADNIQLPMFQTILKPANPYETFCLAAAGCVFDDGFDWLCDVAVGRDRYMKYFERWRRDREPMTIQPSDANAYWMQQEVWRREWQRSFTVLG